MSLVLAGVIGSLYAIGVFLMLERSLTRILIGLALMGHGSVLLLLFSGGPHGQPPFAEPGTDPTHVADPLPQAMALTAIVITFGVLVFLLALSYRSWTLTDDDEVEDDREDARLVGRGREPHRVERDLDALERDLEDR